MYYKWIGAIFIISGCGGFGISLAANFKRSEKYLHEMVSVVEYMESDLQYRLTPLPELCRQAGMECSGVLKEILQSLAKELEWQISPDAYSCMVAAIKNNSETPLSLRKLLIQLGHSLGRFDLPGQLRGLQSVRAECENELKKMRKDREVRLRNYQTLALCAGMALAILFI